MYVCVDEILRQYVLVRHVDVHHIEESYWTGTDGQPLSRLVEDLVEQVGSSISVAVKLVDEAVMRKRLRNAEFERPRDEARIEMGRRE